MTGSGNTRVVLLAVFVVLALLVLWSGIGGSQPEGTPRLATRIGGPNGAHALFQASLRLGLQASSDETPPLEWEQPAAARTVRALLGPTRELAAAEAKAVLDWVASGGDLLLCLGDSAFDLAGHRLRAQLRTARDEKSPTEEVWDKGVTLIALGAGRILYLEEPTELTSARLLGLAAPEPPLARWVRERLPEEDWVPDLSSTPVDPERGVVLVQHLVRFAAGRAVLFDDSAHGLGARIDPSRRLGAFLWTQAAGHALAALLALVPLWLLVRGARRGPPLPPPAWADSGRSSLEHARALASLWADSRATKRPRELLAADLSERLGAGRDPKALHTRLARMAGDNATARADTERWNQALAPHHPIDPRELTELAKARKRFLSLARNS